MLLIRNSTIHFGTPNSILEEIQGPLAPPVSEQVSERVADALWLLLPNHCVVPSCSDREAPTSLKNRRDPQRKSRTSKYLFAHRVCAGLTVPCAYRSGARGAAPFGDVSPPSVDSDSLLAVQVRCDCDCGGPPRRPALMSIAMTSSN